MPVKKGFMSPQNVFIENIIRKFDGSPERNFILGNAQLGNLPIVYSNDGFCRLTGYRRTEILQNSTYCDFLCGQGTDPIAIQTIRDALQGSDEKKVQVMYYKKNGTGFLCSVLIAPIKNENGSIIMYIVNLEDVTSSPDLVDVSTGSKPNPWSVIRRRLSKGTLKFTPVDTGGSETNVKDIELKEVLIKSNLITRTPCPELAKISEGQLNNESDSIEKEASMFDFNRRRATSCVEISPRMVEVQDLQRESQLPQEKADSLDNFLSKLTSKNGSDFSVMQCTTGKQPSMTSLQSITKLTVHSKSTQDLKPKKTEKFAQVLSLGTDVLPEFKLQSPPMHPWTILHYSPFKAIWDWLILALVTYTAVVTPYMASFVLALDQEREERNHDHSTDEKANRYKYSDPLVIVDYVVDIMFVIDIFINFRTTYVDSSNEIISSPCRIAVHYMKTWFIVDIVAAIPFELLFMIGNGDQTTTLIGLLKTARLLRLVRVVRKLDYYSEYGAAVLCLLMLAFALIAHWLACVWFAIGNIERRDPTVNGWLDTLAKDTNQPYNHSQLTSGPSQQSRYVTALYFTLSSLTSVGFGNVSPNTNAEKIFSICVMLVGSLFYAAVFGNVAAIIARLYSSTAHFHEQMQKVREFIRFYQLPKHLRHRIEDYAHHQWSYTNGIDMDEVMQCLPECLQADICVHMHRQLISEKKVFASASRGFLREFSLKLRTVHLPPGDYILYTGDQVDTLYFITRGTVEVVDDRDFILAILGHGDVFGDDFGLYVDGDMKNSTGNVRALTYCDLHKITRDDLIEVLLKYPKFLEVFNKEFDVTFNLTVSHEKDIYENDLSSTRENGLLESTHFGRSHGNVDIPIIIETSPEGRANIPLKEVREECRPCFDMKHVNARIPKRHKPLAASKSPCNHHKSQGERICGCSCLTKIEGQLHTLTQRLDQIESKIGGDIEAIFTVLKKCQEALKQKGDNLNETVI